MARLRRGKKPMPAPSLPPAPASKHHGMVNARGEVPFVECMSCGRMTRSPIGEREHFDEETVHAMEAWTGHPLAGHFEPAIFAPGERVYYHAKDEPLSGGVCSDCAERTLREFMEQRRQRGAVEESSPDD